jgi:protein arginine kinase activator
MKCERCGKEDAKVKFTRIDKGGGVMQVWLCQPCAAELSPYQKQILQNMNPVDMLLKELMKAQKSGSGAAVAPESTRTVSVEPCPSCGLEYTDYKKTSMLGCPDCYEAFAEHLEADLRRLHRGATRHAGNPDASNEELVRLQRDLRDAREELKSALEFEDYERAAFLRDEIASLEQRLQPRERQPDSAKS